MNDFSIRLQSLLDKKGIKPAAFAEEIQVNKSTISRILKGLSVPTADTLYKTAGFFGVTMEYLMTGKSCVSTTLNGKELELIENFRRLSTQDQYEISEIIKLKLHSKNLEQNSHMGKSSLSTDIETDRKELA